MRRAGGTRIQATRKPIIVIAGEDQNDRSSLRAILEAFCPEMHGRIVEINDSVRLRAASPINLSDRVNTLSRKIKARAVRDNAEIACVFVHEDLDQSDGPLYVETRHRVQAALSTALGNAHYVLAVWEMEAWLLLFPEAISQVVHNWVVPHQRKNGDTGRFYDPKRIMMNEVSRHGRSYRESDSVAVFKAAFQLNCLSRPTGSNRSWTQLITDIDECCRKHLS